MLTTLSSVPAGAYTPRIPAWTEQVPVRGIGYQVRRWGRPGTPAVPDAAAAAQAPPLVLLHGWMDVGASYQFVVDALGADFVHARTVLAPDWRGFGHSMPSLATDHFRFADYYADLDALLRHYTGAHGQVDLVGHSMGGNVAMGYAGLRPERVRRLVNVEGFGLADGDPTHAAHKLRAWLNGVHAVQAEQLAFAPYPTLQAVAQRLQKNNRRLPTDKALWLAGHWAAPAADGLWHNLGHPAHKVPSDTIYSAAQTQALYAEITAPTLMVEASDDSIAQWSQGGARGNYSLAQFHQRLQAVPDYRIAQVPDSGHMVHHDQPAAVAALIADFLQAQ